MRALALVFATGCVTAIQPRQGTLVDTAPDFTADSQRGPFSLAEARRTDHVVLVFYRGFW